MCRPNRNCTTRPPYLGTTARRDDEEAALLDEVYGLPGRDDHPDDLYELTDAPAPGEACRG